MAPQVPDLPAPLSDEDWLGYLRCGEVWRRFDHAQRAAILALPVLPLKTDPRNPYRQTSEVEQPAAVRNLLKQAGCNPDLGPAYHMIRLFQIWHALGDAFAPGGSPKDLARIVARLVLNHQARDEFDANQGPRNWWDRLPAETDLDLPRLASRARLSSFLKIPEGENGLRWEAGQHQSGSASQGLGQFSGSLVTEFAKQILTLLAKAPAPVPLRELIGSLEFDRAKQSPIIAKALRGLSQHVFIIAACDPVAADLRLGLWPPLRAALDRQDPVAVPPPAAPEPAERFHEPFLCTDLAALVAAAVAKPLPLKKQRGINLFAQSIRDIAGQFIEVPHWLPEVRYDRDARVEGAATAAFCFEWLEHDPERHTLSASAAGRAWLALPPFQRLRELLDLLRRRRYGSRYWSPVGWNYADIQSQIRATPSDADPLPLQDQIRDAWRKVPPGTWLGLDAWLDHATRAHHPVVAAVGRDAYVIVARPDRWGGLRWVQCDAESLEREARELLRRFFLSRLLPLGGVELGHTRKQPPVFLLNDFGRYYLGTLDKFPDVADSASGRVVVQPNFEIAFLGPNLVAEATLATFCERLGRHTGSLFRLTRARLQQALHQGLSVAGILATLREVSAQALPANVARELESWSESRKLYRATPAVLLRCPDATVALRVHGLLQQQTVRLSDTVLELTRPLTSAQRRKLEAAGLFQEAPAEDDEPAPKPSRRRSAKRRRRW